jgi:hypothetical protein
MRGFEGYCTPREGGSTDRIRVGVVAGEFLFSSRRGMCFAAYEQQPRILRLAALAQDDRFAGDDGFLVLRAVLRKLYLVRCIEPSLRG